MADLREGERLELKERWTDRALEDLAAFANHQGGVLLVGVSDDGGAVGFDGDDRALQRISNQVVDLLGHTPRIQRRFLGDKEILEVSIEPAALPVPCRGRYLVRVGSVNREMSGEEIARRMLERMGQTWDAVLSPWGMDEVDADEVNRFVHLARPRIPSLQVTDQPELVLENLDLLRQGRLTNAGVLLFGKRPQRLYPLAQVRAARFSEGTISGDRSFAGTLWAQLDGVMEYLHDRLDSKLHVDPSGRGVEGLRRSDVWPYPIVALREILLNALMHRDYATPGDIQVRLHGDRMSVWNPGTLFGGLTVEDLRQASHPSRLRNPLIAHTLYMAGLVERWGTGTTRVLGACLASSLPEPIFEEDAGGFRVVLAQDVFVPERIRTLGLSDRQEVIIQRLREVGKGRLHDLMPLFPGLSEKTVQRDLQKLVERGLVRAVGEKRGRYYELIR